MVLKDANQTFVAAYLVKRKSDMSYADFKTHQLETHAPLALALPGLLDYKLTFFPPVAGADQPFDAMAQVTFETSAAHDAALGSKAGQEALADLPLFLATDATRVLAASEGDQFVGSETN